jgi:hypothetical protein
MKLKALKKCWDYQKEIAVPAGEEFDLPTNQAQSLIKIGAAIALPVEPAPLSVDLLEEDAIAPPLPKPELPKPTKKPKT